MSYGQLPPPDQPGAGAPGPAGPPLGNGGPAGPPLGNGGPVPWQPPPAQPQQVAPYGAPPQQVTPQQIAPSQPYGAGPIQGPSGAAPTAFNPMMFVAAGALALLIIYDLFVLVSVRWGQVFVIHSDDDLVKVFPPLLALGFVFAILALILLFRRVFGWIVLGICVAVYHIGGFFTNLLFHQTVALTTRGVVHQLGGSRIFLILSVLLPIVVLVVLIIPPVRRSARPRSTAGPVPWQR